MTDLIHIPSGRRCKPVPMRHDAGIPGGLHLADGLVLVETRNFEIRAVVAVPVAEISTPDGQGGAPYGHLDEIRPMAAAARIWPSLAPEIAATSRRVVTDHVRPPVPHCDWSATFDDYDSENNDPIAYGPTEAEAVANLLASVD